MKALDVYTYLYQHVCSQSGFVSEDSIGFTIYCNATLCSDILYRRLRWPVGSSVNGEGICYHVPSVLCKSITTAATLFSVISNHGTQKLS